VLNKADLLPPAEATAKAIAIAKALDCRGPAFLISGVARQGTTDLTEAVMRFLETGEAPARGNLVLPERQVKKPAASKAGSKATRAAPKAKAKAARAKGKAKAKPKAKAKSKSKSMSKS
jgi:hypothetical protein